MSISTTTMLIIGASVVFSLVIVFVALRAGGLIGPRKKVLCNGTPGVALLLGIQPTGTVVNHINYVCRLQLRVQVPGSAPYDVEAKDTIPVTAMGMLAPGATVPVRVDPADPAQVFLDLGRPVGHVVPAPPQW